MRDDELDEGLMGIWAGSEAMRAMQNMQTKQTEDGLRMRRTCEQCQAEMTIEIPWSEIYAVSCGVFPQQIKQPGWSEWRYNTVHNVMHPIVWCPRCAGSAKPCLVFFGMTPNDARRHFQAAAAGNVMSQRQANMIRQLDPHIKRLKAQTQAHR